MRPSGLDCPATGPRGAPTCGAARESRPGKAVSRGELAISAYRHRKAWWVQERWETLAGSFRVDVTGFAVMSNYLYVVLRT